MKKILLFCATVLSMTASAETFTLDLSTATDFDSKPIVYETKDVNVHNDNLKDVWNGTITSDAGNAGFIMTNEAKMMFKHEGNPKYASWCGFTVSKHAADSLGQFTCMAKGGLAGVGTPFLVGYSLISYTDNELSTQVAFSDEYFPTEVYICQSSYTFNSIMYGDGYAKKFTDKDTLALIISGFNATYEEIGSVTYYLAVDGKFNQNWTKVDLSSIGKCFGLNFRMTSTDKGQWGINTPTYFALDGLTISTEKVETGIQNVETSVKATKRLVNGELIIEHNGNTYNAAGQLRK